MERGAEQEPRESGGEINSEVETERWKFGGGRLEESYHEGQNAADKTSSSAGLVSLLLASAMQLNRDTHFLKEYLIPQVGGQQKTQTKQQNLCWNKWQVNSHCFY